MDPGTEERVEETVIEILKNSNMDEVTEYMVRKSASEKLGLDLNDPARKKFVREVVDSYLSGKYQKNAAEEEQEEEEEEAEEEEEEHEKRKNDDGFEYDDEGGLIICRLNKKRRVTLSEFRGKTLVSIREYYDKGGKELPTAKGISLTTEQWAAFKKNVPAIEKAIRKMESRLN